MNFKSIQKITTASFTFFIAFSCSEYNKNPVEDITQYREYSKSEIDKDKVEPQVIEKTIIVEKPTLVTQEQVKIDGNLMSIQASDVITFTEGLNSEFSISTTSFIPDVKTKLTADTLPSGMSLKQVSVNQNETKYKLSWKPERYFVKSNQIFEKLNLTLTSQFDSAKEGLKAISIKKTLTILVVKQNVAPTDLKVIGLENSIAQGKQTSFVIQVKVPGYDSQTADKPILVLSPDSSSLTPTSVSEGDATRHIRFKSNESVKYLKDDIWSFELILDTQNVILSSNKIQSLKMIAKVYSPNGLSTPEQLIRVKIEGASNETK